MMNPATVGGLIPAFDPVSATYLFVGLGVAAVVVASRTLSRITGVPYPVFLVVVGAAASFVPHVGPITLDPRVVFLGVLPPLVFHAGLLTSPRELRANALPIGLGALGLVLATAFAVAGVAFAILPAVGWAGAVVLGSVVAPTDPVAATSVLNRLSAPPHVTTILEGESLVNDGIALALFVLGVRALAAPISLGGGVVTFVEIAFGGVGFGLAVGLVASAVTRPLNDSASQMVVSLVVPFAAYLPADSLGVSGVLATLTAGLVLGQRSVSHLEPVTRIRLSEFWQVLVFILESALFLLVGLQLRHLLDGIGGYSIAGVALLSVATVIVVVLVRVAWWMALPNLRFRPQGRVVDTGEMPWRERFVLGWSGLRGAISLAAALSIPIAVRGHRLAGRDVMVFTTFCVIVATLVVQGTTLRTVLRLLGLVGSKVEQEQTVLAERRCAEAALLLLDRLVAEEEVPDQLASVMRQRYELRLERARQSMAKRAEHELGPSSSAATVDRRLLRAQYRTLQELHRKGEISYEVMRTVRRQLDLEHARNAPGTTG